MWPITADMPGLWLALYLVTFALHAVFISYVVGGTAYALVAALRGREDPIAEGVRDRLPFMLGCGITAGVAPLLFLQLLYQRRFYTANLLMGPRWGAVVPALIVGFYALYLVKASAQLRWRRIALAVALACFGFVAWSWTEEHELMSAEPAWRQMYAAGQRIYGDAAIGPRLAVWLGAMASAFAIVAAWWTTGGARRRLVVIGLAGRVVSLLAALLLYRAGGASVGAAHGWSYLLLAALAIEAVGWTWTWRAPSGAGLAVVTGAGTAALLAATVVREAPRLALLEPSHGASVELSGALVFVATAVVGVAALTWIVRAIRGASPS